MIDCTSLLLAPAPADALAMAIGAVSAAIAGGSLLAWRHVKQRERLPPPMLAAAPKHV